MAQRLNALRTRADEDLAGGEPAPLRPGSIEAVSEIPPQAAHGFPANVASLPSADRREKLRILEAILFAASEPLDEATLAGYLKTADDIAALLCELQGFYASRGIVLVKLAGKWAFRTAGDLAYLLEKHTTEERKLSRAELETLAIISYHQPVTRAEIEEIRGVATSKGTLDALLETGWVRPRGRRRAPGKPVTYGTTDAFLQHFGLASIKDLPGQAELKALGLLDGNLPADFKVPDPTDVAALMPDELPLEAGGDDEPPEATEHDPDEHETEFGVVGHADEREDADARGLPDDPEFSTSDGSEA